MTSTSSSAGVPPPFPPASLPYPADWTPAQLIAELQSSMAASVALDRELTDLVSQRAGIERVLAKSSPQLMESVEALLRSHAGAGRIVASSNASAQALSSKVRELDEVAANVSAALGRVESVLSLRHTIERVRERLTEGQLLPAAEELYRALFVSQPIQNDLSFGHLLELERRAREEAQREAVERTVRQGRAPEGSPLQSKEILRLARVWPKLGFGYRGLVMHCAQVRLECLAFLNKSGWTMANQHENALIDYTRNVGSIIETVNNCIIQHLLQVQSLYGNGAQIRLIQELLTHVIDVEVASKLMARFIEEKKIKDPKGGTLNPNTEDVISQIKIVNAKVLASQNSRDAQREIVGYYKAGDPVTQFAHPLYITHLDELLDEMKFLAHDIEEFLKGIDQLARQSLEFLAEAVAKEKQAREDAAKAKPLELDAKRKDDLFARFASTPNLDTLPSVHAQHDRVMTLMHKLLSDDKHQRNILDIPVTEERPTTFGPKLATIPAEDRSPIPPALLNLPASSPFLIGGFGLDPNVSSSSRLYDMQLTLIGKYVLIEEYYMNYNIEKACAIDEHDGTSQNLEGEDGVIGGTLNAHDDLELELEAADSRKEREKRMLGNSSGLSSVVSAISAAGTQVLSGVDPYLYLTGIGAAPNGIGIPKTFLLKFATHRTSTLVDNVSFLYKKCLQRAVKTGNRDAIYSILLRVHENFHKKLRRVFESSISYYETRFGSKRKSSVMYSLFQNPQAYLQTAASSGAGGNRTNILGAWVSAAGAGGAPTQQEVHRKITGDVSLILTVNNLDSTLENMQALLKFIEQTVEEMFGEENTPAQQHQQQQGADSSHSTPSHSHSLSLASSHYSKGLSLDQLKEKLAEFYTSFFAFDALIGRGLQCIAENCWLRILPRISLLHTHAHELYGQSELSSAGADLSDQLISGYIDLFRRDILSLSPILNENNFYQLIFRVVKLTVRYLENLVLPKQGAQQQQLDGNGQPLKPIQFTQAGGLQFDKQIRTLTSFFTSDVAANLEKYFSENFFLFLQPPQQQRSSGGAGLGGDSSAGVDFKQWRVSFSGSAQARQLFSKLAHVGSILSVDKPQEVLEYTERELFNLKKEEVRRILSLRVEFSEREISALKW
jgi:hypothetical protein